ncbi:DUF3427 domain-containing protein [Niastella sp. OAS944]|uniref:DUF3427 domain-containing protein n=1 Tax=Niastella sp. OAS944 TaxID=2664089 RepID=UPI00347F7A65|nr:superfamily II DNA or RNA helicase [Chitinophagaceae bacterium OAS944]
MNLFYNDLAESIKTGFLDQHIPCKKEHLPQLLVNADGKKVLTTILKELSECQEFWFSVAFVTKGGVATIINTLKELEARGITGKILASQYQYFTEPEALKTLLQLTNIQLKMAVIGDFHAKGYLFKKKDGYSLIIGSSNLTDKALSVNKELNIKISATENSDIIHNALVEFNREFKNAQLVNAKFIQDYEIKYKEQKTRRNNHTVAHETMQLLGIKPNKMQTEALANLKLLRAQNKEKALLISATATGKTYLSAFDVKETCAKRCLFIVHRANIAEAAMESFIRIFGNTKTMGMFSGERKETTADFLFCTVQTISKETNLLEFNKDAFDYIIIDETHRSGAESYQKILNYFKPKFLLGMTATPERTDGFDIFKQFNHDIAYEIRLQRALEEDMLCSFHYYGITDVIVEERSLKEDVAFDLLVSDERVNKVIEKAILYGCDNGCVRGLIFCSSIKESKALSEAFNKKGYRTVALSGEDSEEKRAAAITRLESNNESEKLDYIFTVDIFNEGIDIPKVNQIILLRPTVSAIIFVQQLGRGLRKADDKAYLTVIDFIGNYSNNYMVPIALFGDTTYNKDTLRKLMKGGSSLIPGASTVNFDKIARERIFKAIDTANLSLRRDLIKDYHLLKYKIGKIPMMVDFIEHGSRDPFQYVDYSKSYFNFISEQENSLLGKLSLLEIKLIELISLNIADAKRIEEVILLKEIITNGSVRTSTFKEIFFNKYGVQVSDATIASCITNINFEFVNTPQKVVYVENDIFRFHDQILALLKNDCFSRFLNDALDYAQIQYDQHFDKKKYIDGFILYHKYSRKDVCRILNYEKDEHTTMYGYKIKNDACPIFVNYHKEEDIVSTTKYEDGFINNYEFRWMSRSRRTLESKEIIQIQNYKDGLRLSLFVKKGNDEGSDFYYMGEVTPMNFSQSTILDDKGQSVPIVQVIFSMNHPVEGAIYEYLVNPF